MMSVRALAVPVALSLMLMALLANVSVLVTFEADTRTDIAEIRTVASPGVPRISWDLSGAQSRPAAEDAAPERFRGKFTPAPDTVVTFRRAGTGDLEIDLASASGSTGTLDRDEDGRTTTLGASATFVFPSPPDTKSPRGFPVFPLVGRARLGAEVPFESDAQSILTHASVRVLAESPFSSAVVDAGTLHVTAGDAIKLGTDERPAYGFVGFAPEGLRAHFRAQGHSIVITRMMAERTIQVSAASVLARDSVVQAMWGVLVLVALLMGLAANLRQVSNRTEANASGDGAVRRTQ